MSTTPHDLGRPANSARVVIDGVAFDAITEVGLVEEVRSAWAAGRGGMIATVNIDIAAVDHS